MKIIKYIILTTVLLLMLACEDSTTPEQLMAAPSNVALNKLSWNSLILSWEDNSEEETGYRIDRRVGTGEWDVNYATLDANSETFIDSNLVEFELYTYRIYAFNENETSNYSEASFDLWNMDVTSIATSVEHNTLMLPLDTLEVQFELLDYAGDFIEQDYNIWFKLLHAPEGTMLNNIELNPTDSISVLCEAGRTNLIITSGYDQEYILIKAYTKNSQNMEISKELRLMVGYENPVVTEIRPLHTDITPLEPNDSESFLFRLLSEHGWMVEDDYDLEIRFQERPEGTNINGELYEVGDVITMNVSPGYFPIYVNSGSECGDVTIKLSVYNPIGEEISLIYSNIVVRELVPYNCDLTPDGISDADDVGDGIWRLKLEAYLTGEYGYDIPDSTEVQFSLVDSPEFAYFENETVFVGDYDNSEPGTARSYLYFDGSYTNETVVVRVESGEFLQDFEISLPLQFPQMYVESNESDLAWNWENGIETISFEIHLSDGQGNEINNQSLLFFTVLGEAVEMGSDEDDNINTEITGYDEGLEQAGIATKDYIFTMYECPPPNGNFPGKVDGILNIQVIGTNLQQDIEYSLYRY